MDLINEWKNNFNNAVATIKGNPNIGMKTLKNALVIGGVAAVLASPQVNANEMDTTNYNNQQMEQTIVQEADNFVADYVNSNKDELSLSGFKSTLSELDQYKITEFQSTFTEAAQKEVLIAGFTIGKTLKKSVSNTVEIFDVFNEQYFELLNKSDGKYTQHNTTMLNYAKAINDHFGVSFDNDAPNFLNDSVSSIYPQYDELPTDVANALTAKMTQSNPNIEYHSAENAVEAYFNEMGSNFYKNGGIWDGEADDMTMAPEKLLDQTITSGVEGVSQSDIDEMPNFLIKYDSQANDYSYSIDNDNKTAEISVASNRMDVKEELRASMDKTVYDHGNEVPKNERLGPQPLSKNYFRNS